MKKIVLISCVSKKLPHPASAQDLYVSPLFRLNLQYARKLQPDAIYILSAKHGLLDLDTEVEPYDLSSLRSSAWLRRSYRSAFTSRYFAWTRKISASSSKPG